MCVWSLFIYSLSIVVQIDSDNESTISFGYQLLPQDDEAEEEIKEAMEIELDPKDELDASNYKRYNCAYLFNNKCIQKRVILLSQ